ncbi:MAG: hypothetical protein AAB410_04625 [Patescibacteria group bacterium]
MTAEILNLKSKISNSQSGTIIVYNLVVIFIFAMVMVGVLAYAAAQLRVIRSTVNREQAFDIAEAGVNYYQWRLAHFTTDYWDGNASTTPGPYIHDYIDKDTNQKIGEYSLQITPPLPGSTIVTIKSTGYTTDNTKQKRTVTVRYGIPSLAQYGFLTHSYVSVGSATTFYGKFHSNSGIQFNGVGNAPITSAKTNYTCQSGDGCSGTHAAIWGTAPASTQAFWQVSVPDILFSSFTGNFSDLENMATGQADLPPSGSGYYGYSLVFNSNATVSVYKVNGLRTHGTGYDTLGQAHSEDIDYSSTGRVLQYTMTMPSSGVIFVKDNVWVEGVVNGRVTVAATKYTTTANQQAKIYIPNNITYLAKDGNHVLGLMAERNVLVTYYSPNDLEINAAMIAQNGAIQRFCFSNTTKNTLTVYGSISSFLRAAFYSYCSGYSGYQTRNYTYDSNLLYGPPPGYPLSSEGYQQISWTSD